MIHCMKIIVFIAVASSSALAASPRLVCYFPSWANYREGDGKYTVDNIDPSLCTHLIYAFAKLDGTSYTMVPHDNYLDVDGKNYEKFVALKKQNSKLITMIAIGGAMDEAESAKYSSLVSSSTNIVKFVNSVTSFLTTHNFNGLDFDWEFPSTPADKRGLTDLMQALQGAFASNGYYLSLAVPASPFKIDQGYDVTALAKAVDFINLMAYDLHGAWEPATADHHAPLYRRAWELENNTNNIDNSVNYWLDKGMLAEKINLGVPLYGRSWTLATMVSVDPKPPAEAEGSGEAGEFTKEPGFLGYHEICYAVKYKGWEKFRDPGGLNGPYATSPYTPKTWVGFDDPEMAEVKVNYAIAKRLGGAMVWDISTDDFGDLCGGGKNPVTSSISRRMGVGNANPSGRFVCYFPSWTGYREGAGRYTVENIDPSLCTDYVYAFAKLDGTSFTIQPYDKAVDIDGEGYKKFVQMKAKNPNIKTWIAIGGWNDSHGSDKYSQLVSSMENIGKFVQSAVSFLKTHGFDGLDIDWEFPMSESDKRGLANLLRTLSGVFRTEGFEISVAMSANTSIIDSGYDIAALNEAADYVNLMAYDMHGPWESKADHHAPLYKRAWDSGNNDNNNIDYTVTYLLDSGLVNEKLNLGIPLYGQSFRLKRTYSKPDPTIPAAASGAGQAGLFTKQDGFLGYNEICTLLKTNELQLSNYSATLNNGPYAYTLQYPYTWVGYDGPEMAAQKTVYALNKMLGGVMVWDMSTDDFKSTCSSQRNPILTAISQALSGKIPTTASSSSSQSATTSTVFSNVTSTRAPTTKYTMTRFTTSSTEPPTKKIVITTAKPSNAPSFKSQSNFLILLVLMFSYYFLAK